MSAQDSIPYLQIRVDGICQVTPTHFTKTIQFRDINYQLSDNEDKQAIFDGWCDFLNYFDSSIKFQFSFVNLTALRESFARAIPLRSDQFESIQRELSKIIREQQAKGNNGIVKTKYLTFGIDADNIRSAKPRLERIETDILNNFKRLGVSAEVLNGQERLRVLHDICAWTRRSLLLSAGKICPGLGCPQRITLPPAPSCSAAQRISAWAKSLLPSASCRFWPRS